LEVEEGKNVRKKKRSLRTLIFEAKRSGIAYAFDWKKIITLMDL
jgi:hypothetical protein